jgi:hypothetical protein
MTPLALVSADVPGPETPVVRLAVIKSGTIVVVSSGFAESMTA